MRAKAFSRNIGAISQDEQEALGRAKVAIAGFGALGQAEFETLLRAGVGNFSIGEFDSFDITNLNRQRFSSLDVIGEEKAKQAAKIAEKINPKARVKAFGRIIAENAAEFLGDADVALDGLDNYKTREIIADECGKKKIPYVFAGARATYGLCSVVTPRLGRGFKSVFGRIEKREAARPIIGAASSIIGDFAAMQALCAVLGKPTISFPKVLVFDGFAKEKFRVVNLG